MGTIYNTLQKINDERDSTKKIVELRDAMNKDFRFKLFCDYVFADPAVKWDIDTKTLNYVPSERPDLEDSLLGEVRRLYIFTADGYPGLLRARKNILAVQLLESVDKNDALLLTGFWKTGKLRFRGISLDVYKKAIGEGNEQGFSSSS